MHPGQALQVSSVAAAHLPLRVPSAPKRSDARMLQGVSSQFFDYVERQGLPPPAPPSRICCAPLIRSAQEKSSHHFIVLSDGDFLMWYASTCPLPLCVFSCPPRAACGCVARAVTWHVTAVAGVRRCWPQAAKSRARVTHSHAAVPYLPRAVEAAGQRMESAVPVFHFATTANFQCFT